MRRRLIVLVARGLAVVVGIGVLVWTSQQGWFSGRDRQLLSRASHALTQSHPAEAQAALEELIATFPESPLVDDALLKLGQAHEAQEQLKEARAAYQQLVERFSDSPLIADTQARLGAVNVALLFSPTITDLDVAYDVKPGDTLGKIAAANHTTVEFLRRSNGLKRDVIQAGKKLKVPKGHFNIVVDKSQNELMLTENNQFIKTYRVATGKDNSTPVGTFKVINKIEHPVWYTQGAVVPPQSPENVLGTRWLGIDKPGYGIHGTLDPNAIGRQVTAGCVRMTNSDVEELFSIVPIGTEVMIVD